MNIRFIDTSVMLNLLAVPHRCSKEIEVKKEFAAALAAKDNLILPLATIIETGNHISHIDDGNLRRRIAKQFARFINESLCNEAPWYYDGCELTETDLRYIVDNFPQHAAEERGLGDMSIILQYEKFKEKTPAIGKIMIWSVDKHLERYREDLTGITRRRDM